MRGTKVCVSTACGKDSCENPYYPLRCTGKSEEAIDGKGAASAPWTCSPQTLLSSSDRLLSLVESEPALPFRLQKKRRRASVLGLAAGWLAAAPFVAPD